MSAGRAFREAARARGEKFYISGELCSRGHAGLRYTANQTCVECSKDQQRRADEKRRQRRDSDPVYGEHRREQRRVANRSYGKRNRDKKSAEWMQWFADRLQRTPKWADLKEIRKFYTVSTMLSRLTGMQHHVDHIIPLRGKCVSGLHIAENLRVIPEFENLSKGAKF